MQAFRVVCHYLCIRPIAPLFLYHYSTRIGAKAGWVSLSPFPKTNLFNAYSASYKGFKACFVKIKALSSASFANDQKTPSPLLETSSKVQGVPTEFSHPMGEVGPIFLQQQNFDFSELHMRAFSAQKAKKLTPSESNPEAIGVPTVVESTLVIIESTATPVEPTSEATPVLQSLLMRQRGNLGSTQEGEGNCRFCEKKTCQCRLSSPVEGNVAPRALVASKTLLPVPEFPLGGLACYVAPSRCRSMWSSDFRPHSLIDPNFYSPFDRATFLTVGVQGSLNMIAFYHIHSLAALEFWGFAFWKSEQIIQREAF
ncbi:hypothetical protein CR513_46923, partial [Mucuna pruriens]